MKVLMGTLAHNAHVQHLAFALVEAGALGAYETGWVYRAPEGGGFRSRMRRWLPAVERELSRRAIAGRIGPHVRNNPAWEVLRTLAGRAGADARLADWLHDRATFSLARRCARMMGDPRYAAFLGTEYGALEPLLAARDLGKPGILAILSPHHQFREAWVDREYEAFPELLDAAERRLQELGRARDRRRDAEAQVSTVIHVASQVTADSWVAAGFSREKIAVSPLGAPMPIAPDALPAAPAAPVRFLYAGQVAVHKGIRHLLDAWRLLAPGRGSELHLCGTVRIPDAWLRGLPGRVVVHGAVPGSELFSLYRASSMLVFPTLCDGFGLVVGEAMSQGLPVIATSNAGASMMIRDGVNGFVVPPADAAALAERMAWCLGHGAEIHAMRRAALATAAEYSWEAFRARVRQQWTGLLSLPGQVAEPPARAGAAKA